MRRLLAIRHPTPAVVSGLCYGQLDVDLLASPEQLQEQARSLSLPTPLRFFSSPSQRCRKFAELLSPGAICIDARLMELNFGVWEGQLWETIDRTASDAWLADMLHHAPPSGESLQQLCLRLQNFLMHLPEESSVLVTHATVIRLFVALEKRLPLTELFSFPVDYASLWDFSADTLQELSSSGWAF